MKITTDPARTAKRLTALEAYFHKNVLTADGDFVCKSAAACSASALAQKDTTFHVGQGTSVSPHYDTAIDGVPFRVLIVPMETGRTRERVQLTERTEEVQALIPKPYKKWNPHMRGVGYAQRLAYGIPLAYDDERMWLDTNNGRVHLLDSYAMANLALCSAVLKGKTTSKCTNTIKNNCLPHLVATMDILEPTLVISQGAKLPEHLNREFNTLERHTPNLATCKLNGRVFIWVSLYHPTRNWEWLSREYLHDTVVPAITEGRARALRLAEDGSASTT